MKKIQNGRILTNQQMKHISGGWAKFQDSFGIYNGAAGGGTCPPTATGTECSGSCNPGVGDEKGTCQTYTFQGNNYCACVVS